MQIRFNIEFVDIGGGLGVDYDGKDLQTAKAVPTTLFRICKRPVSTFVDVSEKNNLPHPNIITESGRSLTAHHSVLVFEVLETATLPEWDDEEDIVKEDDHELVRDMYKIYENLNQSEC